MRVAAALVLLLADPAIAVSPALSPAPRVFLARQRPLRAAPRCSSSDPATEVARWCVANGQSDAAVVVSGATGLAEAMRDFWYVTHSIGTTDDAAPLTALAFPAWSAAADGSLSSGQYLIHVKRQKWRSTVLFSWLCELDHYYAVPA